MRSPWNRHTFLFCRRLGVIALAAGSLLLVLIHPVRAKGLPFSPGEEVRYDVRWQMYKAGEVVMRVLPFTEVRGQPAWHFELKTTSNEFIDLFYKVRDHLQGFVAEDFSGSVGYQYSGTGKKKKEIRVEFSPGRAAYSNFDEHREPIDIPEGCFDPLSSYYKMRTLGMGEGQSLSFPVTDGKKFFVQKGDVLEKETVTTPAGTFDTVAVVPYVTHFSGVFSKSRNPTVRVWITDDSRRIPVRIRIQVKVGCIYFDLRSYTPGPAGAAAETPPS